MSTKELIRLNSENISLRREVKELREALKTSWEGIGTCEGGSINLDMSDAYSDIVYLTHGTLKPGKRYRITVKELEEDTTDWCDCDDPDCPNFRPVDE